MKPIENLNLRKRKCDETLYRSEIGKLIYLAVCTRPDIMFAVSRAARKNKNPTLEDWANVERIFKYLSYTINYGIKFTKERSLKVYVYADYTSDTESRKTTSGFLMMIGNAPTSWYSKLQKCVATSTINSITINIDNMAAIYNCQNQSINSRSKHIDIKYHQVRELIKENKINLKYINSKENLADGFTKYLCNSLMDKFRNSLLTEVKDHYH